MHNTTLLGLIRISLLLLSTNSIIHAQSVTQLIADDFNKAEIGQPPKKWTTFKRNTIPAVKVVSISNQSSTKYLLGQQSNFDGLVALTKSFPKQQRIQIEFTFAFSRGNGRSLNVWSIEPQGRDASQLNLCIQNGALRQFDGRTRSWVEISRNIKPSSSIQKPIWHRLRIIVDANQPGIDYWLSKPGDVTLPNKRTATRQVYRTNLPLAGIALVSGKRIAKGAWYLIDDLRVTTSPQLPAPQQPEALPEPFKLWSGSSIPTDPTQLPIVSGVTHHTIHRATKDGYKFLHGAAIIHHKGILYANWANSPTNENGPHETLQGRRSSDGGKTWSEIEVIGSGFKNDERHSHGVLLVHQGQLWTICARFGKGKNGRRFPGLKAEAFVLNARTNQWQSQGIVMHNCWPYDQPVRMDNGNYITGGQDKDGLPVIAVSQGEDLTKWKTVSIPYPSALAPSFAETTVQAQGKRVIAVIRGGRNVAWVSTSNDYGNTWSKAKASNMPMPRAKAYLGKLSNGQWFLVSNLKNRDTLVISVSKPGETTLSKMWRIRHGKSTPPRFPGRAKGKQWSYPYAHEYDGKLYVVYSIGKEDCGLSIIPIKSLTQLREK